MKKNLLIGCSLAFLLVQTSYSAIFYVTSSAGDSGDGSSWRNAYPELQSALAIAQAGDEIWVSVGSYYPDEGGDAIEDNLSSTFTLLDGVAIYGGFDGTETARAQRDPAANKTILSGDLLQDDLPGFENNLDNAYRVLTAVNGISSATIVDGFTITAGSASGSGFPDNSGGGIFISSSAGPSFANCSFVSNNAVSHGGAVYSFSTSFPTFTNCSFRGNVAGGRGAGIYVNVLSDISLVNCSLSGNFSQAEGGGIFNNAGSTTTLINCTLQGNRGELGGGIFNQGELIVTNSIAWNNRDHTGTGTGSSAILNLASNSTTTNYNYSLIQGINPPGTGNLDGTLAVNDPIFTQEITPVESHSTGGDFRLLASSPAIDAGTDDVNDESHDLAQSPRKIGTIDLGAFEFDGEKGTVTFATLYPSLEPNDDDNDNGRSNFFDYASGGNPTATNDPTLLPSLDGNELTVSYRNNATDVVSKFQKSTTLLSNSWEEMEQETDYRVISEVSNGSQTLLTVELLTSDSRLFFRQVFPGASPQ